jgi:hypothetical protein
MHPEILRELNAQHNRELRERAHQARIARTLRAIRRGTGPAEAGQFDIPDIPDYVDGSFRADGDQVVSRVPAGRRAA